MELGYSATEMTLEWDSRKVVVEFVLAVDHSKEFEHRGHFQIPTLTFLEVKGPFHRVEYDCHIWRLLWRLHLTLLGLRSLILGMI